MLRPSPAALVAAVAEVLAGEVADGIEPGPARDQVRDAAAVLKRVARALPDFTTFLLEDIHDLAAALERLGRPVELPPDLPKASDPVGLEALTELALDLRRDLPAWPSSPICRPKPSVSSELHWAGWSNAMRR